MVQRDLKMDVVGFPEPSVSACKYTSRHHPEVCEIHFSVQIITYIDTVIRQRLGLFALVKVLSLLGCYAV